MKDIIEAIKVVEIRKAAGKDGIRTEIPKANIFSVADLLRELFIEIWGKEGICVDWETGLIVEIPKKKEGGTCLCDSCRGISLLSTNSKVFTKILLGKIDYVKEDCFREHAKFRPNKSCVDLLLLLREAFPSDLPQIINIPITVSEVTCSILSLKSKNSCGCDGLSNKMLKLCGQHVSKTSYLYLQSVIWPD
jgi:hypothetical protein